MIFGEEEEFSNDEDFDVLVVQWFNIVCFVKVFGVDLVI